MNAIEQDFLKVIKQRAEFLNSEDWLATELAGKMERFEKWRKQNIRCTTTSSYWLQTKRFKTYADLYSYWLQEIDGK